MTESYHNAALRRMVADIRKARMIPDEDQCSIGKINRKELNELKVLVQNGKRILEEGDSFDDNEDIKVFHGLHTDLLNVIEERLTECY